MTVKRTRKWEHCLSADEVKHCRQKNINTRTFWMWEEIYADNGIKCKICERIFMKLKVYSYDRTLRRKTSWSHRR